MIQPSRAWSSWLSWRITMSIFLALTIIPCTMLYFTSQQFKAQKFSELRNVALYTIQGAMEDTDRRRGMPFDEKKTQNMLSLTPVRGLAVYSPDNKLLGTLGAEPSMKPLDFLGKPVIDSKTKEKQLETLYTNIELGRPYNIVARADTTEIEAFIDAYVRRSLLINVLMSGLITSILMLALGLWILEPIMHLCDNLTRISQNPELPDNPGGADMHRLHPGGTLDEIGSTLHIANELIHKNARNINLLQQKAENQISKLAYYDALTNLPNRAYFLERISATIKQKVLQKQKSLIIIVVDLDHFKDVNDTMGYEMGDKLLEIIGKRLVKASPIDSVVARTSANEFSIMTLLDDERTGSEEIIENVFASIHGSVRVLNEHLRVTASLGITHCPDDGTDAQQLLRNAGIALHRAKSEGRETICHYSTDFNLHLQKRFKLLHLLQDALDEENLRLQFQPQFDLKTGQLVGAETLLRLWQPDDSKDGGHLVSHDELMGMVGRSALLLQIGEWVLRTSCRTAKMWQDQGLPPFCISVNVTSIQFHRGNIIDTIELILKETGLDPKWLEIEVTESVFMNDMENTIETLHQLHDLGITIAIDDFGTGYSSLNYLRQLSIDRLKIDQVFVRNALVSDNDRTITRTIIALGHSLGLKVMAEGVETADHEAFLREEGCDEAQGFRYTLPLSAEQFWDYAVSYNKTHKTVRAS